MALIKCPDCGKEISDKASACIHCGCPVQQEVHIMPTQPSKIVATEVSTQSRTKSKQIIAAVLSLSSLMLTVHAIFFQNQEILSMTRFLSGGVLAFYSMLIYLLSAFGYVFLQKHIKAGAILTTSYTLAILLCQVFLIFRNSFSLPLCLLTIIVVLAYAVIYWLAATGTFKNANPLMYVVIGYLACICFEMFFSTRYGTSFSSAFLFVQLPTVLYYVSTVLFAVAASGLKAA